MSNPTQPSDIRLYPDYEKLAWDIQELDLESEHLNGERYFTPLKDRFRGFVRNYREDTVVMDSSAALALFLKRLGYGHDSGDNSWTVSFGVIKCISSYFDRGGYADMSIGDYLKAMV